MGLSTTTLANVETKTLQRCWFQALKVFFDYMSKLIIVLLPSVQNTYFSVGRE